MSNAGEIIFSSHINYHCEIFLFYFRDLYILKNLPAQYLHRPNKSLMCLLTLSLIKNLIKLQFKNPDVTIILTESSKFLQGNILRIKN